MKLLTKSRWNDDDVIWDTYTDLWQVNGCLDVPNGDICENICFKSKQMFVCVSLINWVYFVSINTQVELKFRRLCLGYIEEPGQ